MADELKHSAPGIQITETEYEHPEIHIMESQVNDDIPVASGGKLVRKSPAQYLAILSGDAAATFDWNSQSLTGVNDIDVGGVVSLGAESDLTIAGGVVTVTKSYHSIVVQGGAGSGNDDLDSATGGSEGDILILKPNTSGAADTVTVKDGAGAAAFILSGGLDFVMDHVDDRLMLIHNGTEWVELSRSSNS